MVAGVHGVGDIPGEESVSVVPSLDIDVEDGRQYSEPTGEQVMAAGSGNNPELVAFADADWGAVHQSCDNTRSPVLHSFSSSTSINSSTSGDASDNPSLGDERPKAATLSAT
ncbi:hypothetical protein V6N13_092692 [Hibiscus sabdariffa]